MSRSLVILLLIIAVVVGGLFVLAGMDTEQAPVRVEKVVPNEKLAQ
jgi:hypothetical protein